MISILLLFIIFSISQFSIYPMDSTDSHYIDCNYFYQNKYYSAVSQIGGLFTHYTD